MDLKLDQIEENLSRNFSNTYDAVDSEHQVTCEKNTILHIAAKSGNKQSTYQILQSCPDLVQEINTKGETPLHIAARLGHFDVARLLITYAKQPRVEESGNNHPLRILSKKKLTALHEAVKNNHLNVVDLLIEEDPGLAATPDDAVEDPGLAATPDVAVEDPGLAATPDDAVEDPSLAATPDDAVKDPGLAATPDDAVESPLFMAVERRFYQVALRILETFPNCSCSGRNGMTIMHAAVLGLPPGIHRKSPECVQKLIMLFSGNRNSWSHSISGADFVSKVLEKIGPGILEEKDSFGWTPLHYAAYIGNQYVVKLFLETNRSLAYTKNNEGMSALHIAAQKGGCIPVIETLIQKCPDVTELLDNKDQTALHVVAANGNAGTLQKFLDMMPFNDLLNEPNKDGNTCLHVAALQGYYWIVLGLENDRRVDLSAINNLGMTAADIVLSRKTRGEFSSVPWIATKLVNHTSLERRVVQESRMAQLDREKLLETTEETELEVPSQDDKPAGPSDSPITTAKEKAKKLLAEHVQNLSTINLLVATIIAGITFSSLIQLPGGYNNDGMPILRNFKTFKIFVLFDSLAFGISAASICFHFVSPVLAMISGQKFFYPMGVSLLLTCLSICFTLVAFISARSAVLNEKGKFNFDDLVPFIFSFFVPLFYSLLIYVKTRVRAMYVLPYWLPSA